MEVEFGMLPPLLLTSPGGFLAVVTFVRPFAVAEGTDPAVRFAVVVGAADQMTNYDYLLTVNLINLARETAKLTSFSLS